MKQIFFTSDLHFHHKNIIKYNNRPFTNVDEHDHHLIDAWNSVVGKNDVVNVLGDYAFTDHAGALELSWKLNGTKYLIMGNHDHRIKSITTIGFKTVNDVNMLKMSDGKIIFMSHYAHCVWPQSHYGAIHLYGHSHGNLKPLPNTMDVGVDVAKKVLGDYRPFSYNEVLHYINQQNNNDIDGQRLLF